MTASVSSRLRLLLDSVPFSRVDPQILAEKEDAISALAIDVGQELAAENIPLGYVVLVVEGTLRVSGRDAFGQPFHHCDGSMLVSGGVSGVPFPVFQQQHAALRIHQSCWLFQLSFGNSGSASHLSYRVA